MGALFAKENILKTALVFLALLLLAVFAVFAFKKAAEARRAKVKTVLEQLLFQGAESVYTIFWEGGLPFEKDVIVEKYGAAYSPVRPSLGFETIEGLKSFTTAVFTESCAEEVFFSKYLEGGTVSPPFYIEVDGRLYVVRTLSGRVSSSQYSLSTDGMKILRRGARTIEVEVDRFKIRDGDVYFGGFDSRVTIVLKKENGKWKLSHPA